MTDEPTGQGDTRDENQDDEADPMTTLRDQTFKDEEVVLDHVHFIDCRLEECRLIYYGTGRTESDSTEIVDCTVELKGPAQLTAWYLNKLFEAGGKGPVINIVQEILGDPRIVAAPFGDDEAPHYFMDLGVVPEAELEKLREELEEEELGGPSKDP